MANNYDAYAPIADKVLRSDGSITTMAGDQVLPPDECRAESYKYRSPTAAKWLLPDGSIVSELPSSGGNAQSDPRIGDLANLATEDKSTVVAAINEVNAQVGTDKVYVTGGTSTAYTITAPELQPNEGQQLTLQWHVDNGAIPTLDLNESGAKPIRIEHGYALPSGTWYRKNTIHTLVYNEGEWNLVGGQPRAETGGRWGLVQMTNQLGASTTVAVSQSMIARLPIPYLSWWVDPVNGNDNNNGGSAAVPRKDLQLLLNDLTSMYDAKNKVISINLAVGNYGDISISSELAGNMHLLKLIGSGTNTTLGTIGCNKLRGEIQNLAFGGVAGAGNYITWSNFTMTGGTTGFNADRSTHIISNPTIVGNYTGAVFSVANNGQLILQNSITWSGNCTHGIALKAGEGNSVIIVQGSVVFSGTFTGMCYQTAYSGRIDNQTGKDLNLLGGSAKGRIESINAKDTTLGFVQNEEVDITKSYKHIKSPVKYYNPSTAAKGTIKITLPAGLGDTILQIRLRGSEHQENKGIWSLNLRGYLDASSYWSRCTATAFEPMTNPLVRFAKSPLSETCILLGNLTSIWNVVFLDAEDVVASHIGYETLTRAGWKIELITDETGFTVQQEVKDANAQSNAVVLDQNSQTGMKIWIGTQAQWDAIKANPPANTLPFIKTIVGGKEYFAIGTAT